MAQNNLEASLSALIEDLKKKVRNVNRMADEAITDEPEKVHYIREKTVSSLNYVADKIADLKMKKASEKEITEVMNMVKERSNELYAYAFTHINSLRKNKIVVQKKGSSAKPTDGRTVNKTVSASAKQTDVKAAEKAKATVLSVEEKALKTLKGWLSPESEDE